MTGCSRRGRTAVALSLAAVGWGLALIAGALVMPVYAGESAIAGPGGATTVMRSSQTLAAVNGPRVLIVVAIPALLAAIAALALHHRCAYGGRRAGAVAWTIAGLLCAFALLGAASIGAFVLPIAVALLVAARLTPDGPAQPA